MNDAQSERAPNARPLEDLYDGNRFHADLYTDPQIFELEIERIYNQGWVWVAHESEIPDAGDFKTTHVGRTPVIVNRGKDGAVNVLLNRCRHRGATVCDRNQGNARAFTCPYHAWSYGLDGRLIGIPFAEGYAGVLDKANFPLIALKVGVYRGLVFASMNDMVEPLDDFLGDAKPWIDLFLHQGGGFPLKVAGAHKFRFTGNWKIQLENTTDGYHFPFVHRTFVDSLPEETAKGFTAFMREEGPYVRALGNGHSVAVFFPDTVDLSQDDEAPVPPQFEELAAQLSEDYPPERVRWILRAINGAGFNLNLFPNIGLSAAFLRELKPLAVDRTEIRHMALVMDGGPEEANRMRLRIHEKFQGAGGFGSPDDMAAWERVQIGAGASHDDVWIMLNRGLNREVDDGEGHLQAHVTDETGMREAYSMWKRMMVR
ncbi:aromatic ring-hydroxylating oxygenase subunit alpha [Sphingopyxis sp. MSC1_008]|jgi:phenylpropionate dioxygenase-like ring-hydroxylating dioxygenase large terminal subunit|uniref:aromatic ring-hydroxylating oxygenase subunit alpha n=1 Tax=Sphingopyxis sp. MSC1_008 TaxID=2909265 RepID=UPI0020BDC3A5|nr:aromatic ring-hydroxylating dioxygenase subunit alpha [Sphingopyxis sp. MSC1_008]